MSLRTLPSYSLGIGIPGFTKRCNSDFYFFCYGIANRLFLLLHSKTVKDQNVWRPQAKEGDYAKEPDFRTLMSRLLFRVNVLAEFHGNGMLASV